MPIELPILKKYYNNVFIETGTWMGDGVIRAINTGFKTIHSIEILLSTHQRCVKRFKENSNVYLHHGDSLDVLPKILENINEPVTFWLDGHFSGEEWETGKGKLPNPLLKELDIINLHPIKTHTILIDDMRCWTKDNEVFFSDETPFDVLDIKTKLLKINPNYCFYYEDGYIKNDILVAYIKE
jgi:hypothetical protein